MQISFSCTMVGLAIIGGTCMHAKPIKAAGYFEAGPQRSLAEAAAKGRTESVDDLLQHGANVNFQGKEGMTALIWALLQQNKKGYEHLLIKGADPNLQMTESTLTSDGVTDGNSATSLAAMHEDPWFLNLALKHGGNSNIVNSVKGVPVIFQCIMLLDHSRPQPRLEQLKLLIAAGANLNARNKNDITPLMYAVRLKRFDMAHLMLQEGADPKQQTKWGTTVVYEIMESHIDPSSELYPWREKVIQLLNAKGIDVDNSR